MRRKKKMGYEEKKSVLFERGEESGISTHTKCFRGRFLSVASMSAQEMVCEVSMNTVSQWHPTSALSPRDASLVEKQVSYTTAESPN